MSGVSQILKVAAGVLLAAFSFVVQAGNVGGAVLWPACPADQYALYRVKADNQYNGAYACSTTYHGEYLNPDDAAESCIFVSGTTNGANTLNWNWKFSGAASSATHSTLQEGIRTSDGAVVYPVSPASVNQFCTTTPPPPPNPCSSTLGVPEEFGGVPSGTACYSGCQYKVKAGGKSLGVCFGSGCTAPTSGAGDYEGTGQSCEVSDPQRTTGEQCQEVMGHTVCTNVADPKCITIDGAKSCYSDAGGVCGVGECAAPTDFSEHTQTPDGAEVANHGTPTPPAPDTGIAGQPAAPDMQYGTNSSTNPATGQLGSGTTQGQDYFSPATAGGSTTNGDPAAPGSCGAPGQPACSTRNSCGGPGQAPCDVKIDESGVPGEAPQFDEASNIDAKRQEIFNKANDSPFDGFSPLVPEMPSGSCQTFEVSFFGGQARTFPPPMLCGFLDDSFKPLIAWILAVLTLLSCIRAVLNANSGGAT